MAIKSTDWLLLMSLFGGVGAGGVTIETVFPDKTSDPKKNRTYSVNLSIGNLVGGETAISVIDQKSYFTCLKENSLISFGLYYISKEILDIEVNVAIDFGKYVNYGEKKETLEWNFGQKDFCFTFGTWRPSEYDTLDIYFNFFTKVHQLVDWDLAVLKSFISEKDIFSELYLRRYELGSEDQKIQKFQKLIESFKCIINGGSQIKLIRGRRPIVKTGDGEFNLMFLSKKLKEYNNNNNNGIRLTTNSISKTIYTDVGTIDCNKNILQFTPTVKNLRLLSEGTRTSEFLLNKRNILI